LSNKLLLVFPFSYIGDIISVAGVADASVNHTLCHPTHQEPLPFVPIDQPTISMSFYVNDSPLAGKEVP
jgi:GTP-binding protein